MKKQLNKSIDCLSLIISFLEKEETVKLQETNKLFYNKIIPRVSETKSLTFNTGFQNIYTLTDKLYAFKNGRLYSDGENLSFDKYYRLNEKDKKDMNVQAIPLSKNQVSVLFTSGTFLLVNVYNKDGKTIITNV